MPALSSIAKPILSVSIVLSAVVSLAAPGCLGRSEIDELDFSPDGSLGAAGSGGSSSGGTAGKGGTGGKGGVAGKGGSVGTGGVAGKGGASGGGAGGSAGVAGASGKGGSVGKGGTGGGPNCGPCKGCCDPAGVCRAGTTINACGKGGVDCLDCSALGFSCTAGACEGPPPVCGPSNCMGCCDAQGRCRFGTQSDACGVGGKACESCSVQGESCVNGVCQGPPPPTCGPQNCGGCCDSAGICQTGTSNNACGIDGAACAVCMNGRVCNQPGSYCAFLPTCGSVNCPTGCCDAQGVCRNGRTDAACGSAGQRCVNCTTSAQACAPQGFCFAGTHCGPDNCAGCCTSTGNCNNGTLSLSCGQFGVLCDNCIAKNQTCQNRVCSSGSTCPAAYSGCSPGSVTPPPVSSFACSGDELARLARACQGQQPGATCSQFLQSLLGSNPACYDCMLQFVGDDAYVKCVAPYLNQQCNHDLTCAVDCSNKSCSACDPMQENQCRSTVFNPGNACRPYSNGYFCLQAAFSGPAGFCDFEQYNDVGRWLQAVGQNYCGG